MRWNKFKLGALAPFLISRGGKRWRVHALPENWAQITFLGASGTNTLAGVRSFVVGRPERGFLLRTAFFVLSKDGEKKIGKKLRKT